MARRILSYRQTVRFLDSEVAAAHRYIVARPIQIGDGAWLHAGEDVTAFALELEASVLVTHVKRGYLTAVPARAMDPDAPPPDLAKLGKRPKKEELVAGLKAAGVDVPSGATYDGLMAMRRAVLMAARVAPPQPA